MICDSWVSWEKGLNTTFLAPESKFDGLFHDLQKSGKTLAIPGLKGWPFSPSSNREFWKLSLAVCGTWTATFMKKRWFNYWFYCKGTEWYKQVLHLRIPRIASEMCPGERQHVQNQALLKLAGSLSANSTSMTFMFNLSTLISCNIMRKRSSPIKI